MVLCRVVGDLTHAATELPQLATLVRWNAEHTTEEVLAAFDKAIEAEEAKT
jgi:hypothetical protein